MWTATLNVIPVVKAKEVKKTLRSIPPSPMMIYSKTIKEAVVAMTAMKTHRHRHMMMAITMPTETPIVLHLLELATSVDQGALVVQGFQHLMSRQPAR